MARTLLAVGAALLAVVIAVAMVRSGEEGPAPAAGPTPAAAATSPTAAGSPTSSASDDGYEGSAGILGPTATSVPTAGAGTFTTLDAPGPASTTTGRVVRYVIQVEDGITVDKAQYAQTVRDVLLDPRGWQTQDKVHFVNVTAQEMAAGARPDVTVRLATPNTVDKLCAPLKTNGKVSCHNGSNTVLNLLRWETGVDSYGGDVARYRIYQINHEVGHAIGHGHLTCPKAGSPAPVMLQQTLGLQGCVPNTWPTVTKG